MNNNHTILIDNANISYNGYVIPRNRSYEILNVEFDNDESLSKCRKMNINLLKYNEIPVFLRHNPYVLSGYRVYLSGTHCIYSMFHWTNETINIWSHLIGFLLFFLLTLIDNFVMIPRYRGGTTDHIIVTLGLACYQFCMLSSAGYHIFFCHSERASRRWLAIDLAGICIGIIGCYLPAVHFAFYCLSIWRDIYLLLITVLTSFVLLFQLHPRHTSNEFWHLRLLLYCSLVGFGVIPTVHWVYLNGGFQSEIVQLFFHKVVVMYFLGILGFFFYMSKIPEYMFPGKLDLVGASHQLWHIVVVIAFYYWHSAGSELLYYRTHISKCYVA